MTGLTVKKQPTLHGWWQVNQITTYPSSMMTGRRSTRRPSLYYVYYNLLQEFKSPTTSRVKNCKNWVNPSYLMKVVCHLVIVHDKRVPTRHQIWRVASSCHERWRVVTTFHNPFLVHGITGLQIHLSRHRRWPYLVTTWFTKVKTFTMGRRGGIKTTLSCADELQM